MTDPNQQANQAKVFVPGHFATIPCQRCADLQRQVAELTAKLDALPKTADGVPVTTGMKVYRYCRGRRRAVECVGELEGRAHDGIANVSTDDCYSTREAAEAARDAGRTEGEGCSR